RAFAAAIVVVTFACSGGASAQAFPATDNDWLALTRDGAPLTDATEDGSAWGDVGGNEAHPAGYVQRAAAPLYCRLRLDQAPVEPPGDLMPHGWGVEIDTDADLDTYELLVIVDGKVAPDTVFLRQNTEQRSIGDPSNHAEVTLAS